ncbi:MAG: riboflavin synthase [Candidatus Peregrinibacteria bacterium]|nr:riboflavin synthase [Candidatus Peregrinibacteria bacterium]MDZ4245090.1 riboflavin synthase [Candidatus Gracilibacteria bacterium]
MFTGIVKEIGTVKSVVNKDDGIYFVIEADMSNVAFPSTLLNGDSISVNGACQTVVDFELFDDGKYGSFTIQSIPETMRVTNFSDFEVGTKVNLEPAMKLQDSIDGHLVQGHIDCTGLVDALERQDNGTALRIIFSEDIEEFIVYKGSITVNGVSLTISKVGSTESSDEIDSRVSCNFFEVSLIAHSIENTNLGLLKKGDKVNLEADMMARYAAKIIEFSNRRNS